MDVKIQYVIKIPTRDEFEFNYCAFTLAEIEARTLTHDESLVIAKRVFTGLHDKNGVEIYDGDILRTRNTSIFIVEWRSEFAGFYCTNHLAKNTVFQIGTAIYHESSEVIGNIHQNPELMEGK